MSETIKDGGPAFPGQATKGSSCTDEDGVLKHEFNSGPGMTLRDYFAGHALAGVMGFQEDDLLDVACGNADIVAEMLAKASYKIADAMLAERIQKEVPVSG